VVFALVLAATLAPAPALAQTPSPAQAQQFIQQNPEVVRQRLRQSGMSDSQVRARLGAAGLPVNILDAYLESGVGAPMPSGDISLALDALGLSQGLPDGLGQIPLETGLQFRDGQSETTDGLPIFGLGQFRRATTQFQPLLSGPVPGDYRLGAGDRLVLVLTGDVELAHELEVTREGFMVIPDVGQLSVTNLTMDGLRTLLRERLGRSYSGIGRGTTTFDITVARLRTNQIYVIGEVMQPGAYQLASVATLMNALYAAGGPTDFGTLRDVQLRRRTGETITLDLYRYLLAGDNAQDRVLEQGDMVYVPLRGRHVSLTGAITRPAQYELIDGEDLVDVLRNAGGFAPNARRTRLTIQRVLPPASRGPGLADRAAIDLALAPSTDPGAANHIGGVIIPPVGLQDGDRIMVDGVPAVDDGYYVTVRGRVQSGGRFPWQPGMTLRDLVELARGPTVGADLREAELSRLPDQRPAGELADVYPVPLDSSYLQLADPSQPFQGPRGATFPPAGSAPEFFLEPFDQVTIRLQPDFQLQQDVFISGEVRVPGRYTLRTKDDRLVDLIERAGGILPTGHNEGARFHRDGDGRVDIDLPRALGDVSSRHNLVLQPGDSLHVPLYSPTVRVRGAVNSPTTVLYREGEGLDYYIENAGGFRRDADEGRTALEYANGQRQLRDKFLFWSRFPAPEPGSIITVPTKDPSDRLDLRGLITDLVAVTGSLATVIIVLTR